MQTEAPPSLLSPRPKWKDLQFSEPASEADGSATLPFVIPTEVEGISRSSLNQYLMQTEAPPSLSGPNRSGGICSSLICIRCQTEAPPSLFCHPDRSGGICSSLNQHPMQTEAPPSLLSSRPKWKDL